MVISGKRLMELKYLELKNMNYLYNRDNYYLENNQNIRHVAYGSYPFGSSEFGGSAISLANCPTVNKFSGDTIILNATPKGGIGPYTVTFKKGIDIIESSRLQNESNPVYNAPEDVQITRVYTLDDLDISSASEGTIDFSVEITDSCPTTAQTCTETCTITIGCIAPVCNFTVT